MANVATTRVAESLRTLLRETFEGPAGPSTYFIDNDPQAGLLATIDRLSPAEASRPTRPGGATIAAHADHVAFHLEVSDAWIRGDRDPRDWSLSWIAHEVDEAGWSRIRRRVRRGYEELIRTIENESGAVDGSLETAIAAAVHAAYHLGAIRQRVAAAAAD